MFRKWLYSHKEEIPRRCYVQTLINAYKNNADIFETQALFELNKTYAIKDNFTKLKDIVDKSEKTTMFKYIIDKFISPSSYEDYLYACHELEIDLTQEKNRYPHDFNYWHDIRIDQYNRKRAEIDKRKRKEFYEQFENIANKYLNLERNKNDLYICVIAKSPQDLINEGEILHHCVGRMNYDQKIVREESLIFFIRNKDNPTKPFVTLEYSLKNNKILQCYGEHNSRPADDVMEYINKTWLPYANRKIKKLVA